jgi:hypothetical protein
MNKNVKSLPKIGYPIFTLKLPSTDKEIKYRPFLVKEEKLLLMAQSSEDPKEIIGAIKQVISNCILSEDVSVDELCTFDMEYIFIKIRAKSINNVIEVTYRDLEDDKRYTVEINLDEIEVKKETDHTNKIEINEQLGMVMKYPKTNVANNIESVDGETDLFFQILKGCIEKIYDSETVYDVSEYSADELDDFIQQLDVKTFKKVQDFFATMPRLHYEVKYTNSLGKEKNIVLNNLTDFFTLG